MTDFLNVRFSDVGLEQLLNVLRSTSSKDAFRFLVTPNVDHVVKLHSSRSVPWNVVNDEASFVLCDSRILQLLARVASVSLNWIPGSDLTERIFESVIMPADTICVIGGDPLLPSKLARFVPKGRVLQHVPPMGLARNPAAQGDAVEFAIGSGARFVFLCVGHPQQELVASRLARDPRARGFGLCVGASLEFLVGDKQRAPRMLRNARLEWAFRLATEPRRLWRRYLVDGPQILPIFLRWLVADRLGPREQRLE